MPRSTGGDDPDDAPCGEPAVEVVILAGGLLRIPRCARHARHLREELDRLGMLRRCHGATIPPRRRRMTG
ncbi:MAG: hypothetical protein R3A52_28550 [Polyangiales bacterium]